MQQCVHDHTFAKRGEELANSLSHGAALLAAIVAVPFLIDPARHPRRPGGRRQRVRGDHGAAVSGLDPVSRPAAGRAKRVFMKLDHCAIYLFIAGSYTPLPWCAEWPWGGRCSAGVVAGVPGVTLKAFDGSRILAFDRLYLLMAGWC